MKPLPFKSALVLGLGSSGQAAAQLLLASGANVCVLDENDTPILRERCRDLEKAGAKAACGKDARPTGHFDVCVTSPGLRSDAPVLEAVIRLGVPVIPEIELAWMAAACPVLAVSGSNGKSTLVKLCAETMQHAGLKAFAAGNCGPPLAEAVLKHPDADWLVAEVSSFQLETARAFGPRVGVLLNIHPNHLDRHGSMDEYARIKARLFARIEGPGAAIVNEANLEDLKHLLGSRFAPVSFGLSARADYRYCNGQVYRGGRLQADFSNTIFANEVMGLAVAAATAAMVACHVSLASLSGAARVFSGLPHRMQVIGTAHGVRFVDDSKATNAAALAAALKMTPGKVRLIAGGLPKNESYAVLADALYEKVAGVYLIGKAAAAMEAAWGSHVPCRQCGTLEQAADEAVKDAAPGETILLSPACASFDQFRNFAERGDAFRRIFERIAARTG